MRFVTDSWIEADRAVAEMAYAAHMMALNGLGGGLSASVPAGVTRFKSGAMDVAFSDAAAAATARGDFSSTRYGVEYAMLRRRSNGGPMLIGCPSPCVPC